MKYPSHSAFLKSLGPDDPAYGKGKTTLAIQGIKGRQPTPSEVEKMARHSKENNDMRYPTKKELVKDPNLKLSYRKVDPYGEYVPEYLVDDLFGPLV